MADLRIVDAPVLLQESITDDVKMPTGGLGNFSIRLGDIVWYVVAKEQLANKNYVDLSSKGVKDSLDVHIADKANPHRVTKVQVGLGNVDNTADIDKPVSNAVSSAIVTATNDMATNTYVNSKDGDLTKLTTTDKTNLVKAINEVVSVKADKATKLVGYGITDAYTKSEIDTNYGGVKTLYDKNVEAGAGAGVSGWLDTLITLGNGRTQRDKNSEFISVKDFGAIGDGTLHPVSEWTVAGSKKYYANLAAIQVDYPHVTSLNDAIDWAAAQKSLNDLNYAYFPHSETHYVINKTLVINQFFARVYSTSMQTTVLNVGTTDMFEVKKDFATFENISLWGTGTTTVQGSGRHGIYFNYASYFTFNRVGIRYHGGHGVYGFNGVVTGKFTNSEIEVNWLDGVNMISPTTADAMQNGNAFSLINTVCSLNKGAGIRWWGAALNISGSNFEKNSDTGIAIDATDVDVTNGTVSAFGINIAGNYFEHNGKNGEGQIKITSKLGAAFSGGCIAGNWMYSANSGGLIQVAGPYRGVKNLTVSGNSGHCSSAAETIILDGGNALDESCFVVATITETKNLALATQIGGYKKCAITGATSAKGVTWTNLAGASDNFFNSTTDVTVDIAIPAYLANTFVNDIKFIVETDSTTQYSQNVYLYGFDPLDTNYTLTNITSGTFSSATNGGNTTINLNYLARLDGSKAYFLRIVFKKMSTGTIRKMHNVTVIYS